MTLYHQAARVTLKLVTSRGGEALANTSWSVVTEGGEIEPLEMAAEESDVMEPQTARVMRGGGRFMGLHDFRNGGLFAKII